MEAKEAIVARIDTRANAIRDLDADGTTLALAITVLEKRGSRALAERCNNILHEWSDQLGIMRQWQQVDQRRLYEYYGDTEAESRELFGNR